MIVAVFEAQVPFIPFGNPANVAPVAPDVEYVMVDMGVLTVRVWVLVPPPGIKEIVLLGVAIVDVTVEIAEQVGELKTTTL